MQNWRECVAKQAADIEEGTKDQPLLCTATVDVRTIPAWKPSPDNQKKRQVAADLLKETEADWQGAKQIVVRDFNIKDPQITFYIKMPDGEYFRGCGFRIGSRPHCQWHGFGQASVSELRNWIFEKPYRLK